VQARVGEVKCGLVFLECLWVPGFSRADKKKEPLKATLHFPKSRNAPPKEKQAGKDFGSVHSGHFA
ncbi:MAG: hypothetical protein KJZ57_02580, partial [Anaerolineales bacterium]|nr:hypothetical protein [Anaerolineales bacterium]